MIQQQLFGMESKLILFLILALFGTSIIAPLPPCSPFLFVNKMIESNNWSSDMNPFYPVKPCPYKDPSKAPHHMRFVTDNGKKFLIDHIQQELAWIRKVGIPRAIRMTAKNVTESEKFRVNTNILKEGYHNHNRTKPFGHPDSIKEEEYSIHEHASFEPMKF